MRSLRLMARPGPLLEAVEIDLAPPGPRQMLVRVERSYVSAGTEMNYYRENPPGRAATPAPLGYMTVGTVEVMGSAIEGYAVGERVLTAGYHGAHWLVDLDDAGPAAWYIERLDPAHDLDSVGFVILADIALHGVRRARLQIDQSVAVFGVGLIGQLTLQLARLSGAYPLIAVDLYPSRLDKARVSGASHVVDAATDDPVAAIRAITGGVGAEAVFHCAPTPAILQACLQAAAERGTVVLTGSPPGLATIGLQAELLRHELTIVGNYEMSLTTPHPYWPWTRQRNRRACLRLLKSGELRLGHLISHVVPYTEAQAMADMMARGGDDWMGIVFRWDV